MRYLAVLLILFGCAAQPRIDNAVFAPLEAELKVYAAMLSAKIDSREMSDEEAQRLYDTKVNELTARYMALAARPAPAASVAPVLLLNIPRPVQQPVPEPAYRSPVPPTTLCRPDGYGGVRCQSY
jgi:hypothetical protein